MALEQVPGSYLSTHILFSHQGEGFLILLVTLSMVHVSSMVYSIAAHSFVGFLEGSLSGGGGLLGV